jgi:hypothetical protein
LPNVVNASCRDDAANTLIVPDRASELDADGEDEAAGVLDVPHPDSRRPVVASTVKVRALRRI